MWNLQRQFDSYHWAVIRGSVLQEMTLWGPERIPVCSWIICLYEWYCMPSSRVAERPEGCLTGFVSTQFRLLLNWLCLMKSNRLTTVSASPGASDPQTSPGLNGASACRLTISGGFQVTQCALLQTSGGWRPALSPFLKANYVNHCVLIQKCFLDSGKRRTGLHKFCTAIL